ncbi:MAG: hypothetical protein PHY66_09735 [Aliarcobacter sp.]|nr:hypothetical protein [Aliarcobacter sp.]
MFLIYSEIKNDISIKLEKLELIMKKTMLLIILIILFQGCATWYGIKKDSSDAWKATKETTGKAYDSTKQAIHEATE